MEQEALYTIGQVSKICDVSQRMLRYYEKVGLITPDHIAKPSHYRYYSVRTMQRVQVILRVSGWKRSARRSLARIWTVLRPFFCRRLIRPAAKLNITINGWTACGHGTAFWWRGTGGG